MKSGCGSKRVALVALGMLAGAGAAMAQEVSGVWERDTGASRVRFTKCGAALCGSLSWLKDEQGPASASSTT